MASASSTPQESREPSNPLRNSWESEVWDDLVAAIYAESAATVTVPMRVNGRLQIWAQANLAAAGVLTISVDGVALAPTSTTSATATAVCLGYCDVSMGNHVVTIAATVGLSNPLIMVRRGRKPAV